MTVDFGLELLSPYEGWQWFDHNLKRLDSLRKYFTTLWICDHFQYPRDKPWHEAFTTLSFLAAKHPQFRLGTLVLGAGYRNPAVVAKMAATLQYLSGGRFILGIGAGWQKDEYEAYGYDFPSYSERVERLEEAVSVIKNLWTASPATFHGKHYHIDSAYCEPRPKKRIPILIGADGRKALGVVAKYADMWNTNGTLKSFKPAYEKLQKACLEIGRDLREIELTCVVTPYLPSDREQFQQDGSLLGPTLENATEELHELVKMGVSHFQVRCHDLASFDKFCDGVISTFSN